MTSVTALVRTIEGPQFALEAKAGLSVIEVLDTFFKSIPITKALAKKVYQFQIGYINTSRDYVEFFGSNLLGVHVIRFREVDVLRFFNEVLEIEYDDLEAQIRETDIINHTFKISGDIFNLTLIYLVHRFLSEKTLDERDKHWGAYNTGLVFFYRAMAAMLSAWFTYPADPKIAQAAYANLSYKFLIKKLGSWHKVMDYRSSELISKSGVQYQKLFKMNNDLDLVDVINDGANSIKDMLKNYYAEFAKVHAQGDKIGVTKITGFDLEGEEVVRDNIRNIDRSIAQGKKYLSDPTAFVRDDLIRVISDINRNTSPRLLKETLVWISGHANAKEYKLIDEAVTKIIIYSFFLINTRIESSHLNDVGYILVQLKNLYLSSRSTDDDLIKIRDLTDRIINKAHQDLSSPLLLATRTATILYITFRVLVGQRSS